MESLWKGLTRRIFVLLAFAGMVIVNWMATVGKINGIATAAVSDKHFTMFTPMGYTFAIWGIIYLFLAVYVLYQLIAKDRSEEGAQSKIAFWFVLSSIANAGWLFMWHYDKIIFSVIIMGVLLFCLINILSLIFGLNRVSGSTIGLEIPFGLYCGWITVATVANLSVMLVDLGWERLGISEFVLTIILLAVAAFTAVAVAGETRNIAYPLAVIWGLFGVMSRYIGSFQLDWTNQSMWIVFVIGFSVLILLIRWLTLLIRRIR